MKKITIDYDEEADVLYLSFGNPTQAITEEINNIGVRVDKKTNEIVGLTILDFMKNSKNKNYPIEINV